MTTITAKRLSSGKVQVAWDAQATSGGQATKNVVKVRKINGQFAVGGSGTLRFLNVIHRASVDQIHPADIASPGFDAEGWLIDVLVPCWARALQQAAEYDPDGDQPEGLALVVLAGRIFEVGIDFSVLDMGEFAAIGSGGPFASTAMHLGKSATQAVHIASEIDLYTGGDVKEMKL
jgi:ATP-dependent protease HslVU (ClpYQ) peptidase subunit